MAGVRAEEIVLRSLRDFSTMLKSCSQDAHTSLKSCLKICQSCPKDVKIFEKGAAFQQKPFI